MFGRIRIFMVLRFIIFGYDICDVAVFDHVLPASSYFDHMPLVCFMMSIRVYAVVVVWSIELYVCGVVLLPFMWGVSVLVS